MEISDLIKKHSTSVCEKGIFSIFVKIELQNMTIAESIDFIINKINYD